MRSSMQFVSALLLPLLLGGCVTGGGSSTAASSVDENSPEVRRKLMKLYAGTEYMGLASRLGTPSYLRRTLTVDAPEPHGVKPVALVTVVYVKDEKGRVREPRVFESSDPKFDEGALNAIRSFDSRPPMSEGAMPLFIFIKLPAYEVVESEEMKKSGRSPETTAAALGVSP